MNKTKIVLKYSKNGLKNGLILLIPIFPIFTLFPMIYFMENLGGFSDCERGGKTVFWLLLIFSIIINCIYIAYKTHEKNIHKKDKFVTFFFFHLLLYSLVNSFVFIAFLGTNLFCSGIGQNILVAIYSGPISSLFVLLNGIIIDLIIYFKQKYNNKRPY